MWAYVRFVHLFYALSQQWQIYICYNWTKKPLTLNSEQMNIVTSISIFSDSDSVGKTVEIWGETWIWLMKDLEYDAHELHPPITSCILYKYKRKSRKAKKIVFFSIVVITNHLLQTWLIQNNPTFIITAKATDYAT